MIVPREKLQKMRLLYQENRYLDAYRIAKDVGDFTEWEGPEARILAARLASRLGSYRLSRYLTTHTYRRHRNHPNAAYFHAQNYPLGRDRVRLIEWIRKMDLDSLESPVLRANWLAFRARLYAGLRDFDRAHADMDLSLSVPGGERSWLFCEQSYLLDLEDRYDEALEAAEKALDITPHFRAALQQISYLYSIQNAEEQAFSLLAGQAGHLQSGEIYLQLTDLARILQRHDDAATFLKASEHHLPLADRDTKRWAAAQWAAIHRHRKSWTLASEKAAEAGGGFWSKVAKNINAYHCTGRRVRLDVGFQRQHYDTCAPATLTVLAAYWNSPVDHLQLSEDICYDGTPSYQSRHWAESEGWYVREFTLRRETAVALIDRGLPFALSTVEPGLGHMQAVIGYDTVKGVLLVRDPYIREDEEFLIEETIKRYESVGPACLLLVPREESSRLENVTLPEDRLYDCLHRLQRSLHEHRRSAAVRTLEEMIDQWPDHRLTCLAGSRLASYDRSPDREEVWLRKLLDIYPDDVNIFMRLYHCLQPLVPRRDRLEMLWKRAQAKPSSPLVWGELADELSQDARDLDEAAWWLRRCIRREPRTARYYHSLAGVLWEKRQFEPALRYFRAAATLADKAEYCSRSYFMACRHFRSTNRAVGFLRRRFERYGHLSAGPACTLFWAYETLDDVPTGFQLLEEAIGRLPDDQELRCFTAGALSRHGRFTDAQRLLDRARGLSHPEMWALYQADQYLFQGRLEEALECYQQVLEVSPASINAIRMAVRLRAQIDGEAEAVAFLERYLEDFPHHQELHELYLSWLPEEDRDRRIAAVRRIIAMNPRDAWAQRELVNLLVEKGDYDSAFVEKERARELAPDNPSYFNIYGNLLEAVRRIDEAKQAYRRAIQLQVDNDWAVSQLLRISETVQDKREALAFIYRELEHQVIFGDGILNYRNHAEPVMDPETLLAHLKVALEARPDLWQTWAAYTQQLTFTNKLNEAESIAREACERFPLLPRVWFELSSVYRVRLECDNERAALEKALEINPAWEHAILHLAESFSREGEFETAKRLIERALVHDRLSAQNYGYLASYEWALSEHAEALGHIERALELDPSYEWAWGVLWDWSNQLEQVSRYRDFTRRLTVERPGEPQNWLHYSYGFDSESEFEDRLKALERAVNLQPHNPRLHAEKARLLRQTCRFQEAVEVCRDQRWGSQVPSELVYEELLIEDERGRREASHQLLEKFLQNHPGSTSGWRRLANYHREAGRLEQYLETCEEIVRTAPQDPLSYGYRMDACRLLGRKSEVEKNGERALSLDPSYTYAGHCLLACYLDRGAFVDATRLLERLRPHWPRNQCLYLKLRLSVAKADQADPPAQREKWLGDALDSLQEMLTQPRFDLRVLEEAVDLILDQGVPAPRLYELIDRQFRTGIVNNAAASYWGEWSARLEASSALSVLRASDFREEHIRCAVQGYLQALADSTDKWRLKRFIAKFDSKIRGYLELWSGALEALASCQLSDEIEEWFQSYRQFEGLRSRMLEPYVRNALSEGRFAEAQPVLNQALQLPVDLAHERLRLFQSLVLLGDRRFDEAEKWLSWVNAGLLNKYYGDLYELVKRTLLICGRKVCGRDDQARIEVLIDRYRYGASSRAFRHAARRCVDTIGWRCGDLSAWVRKQRRQLWTYSVPRFLYQGRIGWLVLVAILFLYLLLLSASA